MAELEVSDQLLDQIRELTQEQDPERGIWQLVYEARDH